MVKYCAEKLGRVLDENCVLDTDISFDGSWHARGHKSLFWADAVIDANTGLGVDYEALSKICVMCTIDQTMFKNKKITSEAYE